MHSFQTYLITNWSLFERLKSYEAATDPQLPVVFDVETNSVEEVKADLFGIGICFTDQKAFYIPIRNPDGSKFWSTSEESSIIKWLDNTLISRGVIGHNIVYDCIVYSRNGGAVLDLHIKADTILMKHTVDEEPPFGLKEIAVRELGEWADNAQDELKNEVLAAGGKWTKENKDMYLASTKTLGTYCCWDVILTKLLYDLYSKKLQEEGLEQLFYHDEIMPVYRECTIVMKRRGFSVDVEHFQKLHEEISHELTKLEDAMYAEAKQQVVQFENALLEKEFAVNNSGNFPKVVAECLGAPLPVNKKSGKETLAKKAVEQQLKVTPQFQTFYEWVLGLTTFDEVTKQYDYDLKEKVQMNLWKNKYGSDRVFNFKSNDHLIELFFNIKGLRPIDKTEKGKPKIDDKFIELAAQRDTIAEKLHIYKKLNKLQSTYVEGILGRQVDGVIYTSMLQFGTTSGRFSSRDPNLQNLPRPREEDSGMHPIVLKYTNSIREGFVAPKNHVLVDADYSALEPRAFAHMSGDEVLRDVFRKGEDLYSRIAIDVFKVDGVSANPNHPNYLGAVQKEFRQKTKVFCFAEGSKVQGENSIISIEKLKVGEKVLTSKGIKAVANIFSRQANTLAFITNVGSFYCTPDHKIWSVTNNCWKQAKDFVEGEEIEEQKQFNTLNTKQLLPVYSNASFKNGKERHLSSLPFDEEWAWALGAFLGDGVGSYTRRKTEANRNYNSHLISSYIGICGLKNDKVVENFTKFFNSLGYKFSTRIKNKGKPNEFHTQIISDFELVKIFQETFKAFVHAEGKGRKNLQIQDFVFNSPQKVKLAFIAGLLDTDGYLKNNKNKRYSEVALCSKELQLISNLKLLLSTLGVDSTIGLDYNKTYKKYYYICRIKRSGVVKLANLGLAEYLVCVRKKQAILNVKNNKTKEVKVIPKVKKLLPSMNRTVYDITVEDAHEFYAEGIRVHNCLAVPYGAEASRISQEMKTSYQEADKIVKAYLNAYPNLKKYMAICNQEAKKKGFVATEFGRIRHLKDCRAIYTLYGDNVLDFKWAQKMNQTEVRRKFKNSLNNAKNFKIQGLAAHIVNRAMLAITRQFKAQGVEGYVALQIHDQIVSVVKEEHAELAKNIMRDCMENTTKISVPLIAEPQIAYNLKESH
jgi:DNA polymerase I-like protein with 3'-5' exonuclease and polymerase domains/intein/homing endonuclease